MRNITVSVDEETHRIARIRAAELDTSVSALVREYLRSLASERTPDRVAAETERERRSRLLSEVIEKIKSNGDGPRIEDNSPREELYDRATARAEAEEAKRKRCRDA